jgi:hypothetical protein
MIRVTYEYQSRVQILVVLLHEVFIVFLSLLAIMLVELRTEILLRQLRVLFLSVREVNDGGQRDAKPSLPIYWVSAWFLVPIPSRHSSVILAAIGDQRVVALGFPWIVTHCRIPSSPRPWDPDCQRGKRQEQRITYFLLFVSFLVLAGGSCPSTSSSRLQARTNQSSYIARSRRTHRSTVISSKSISAMMGGLGMVCRERGKT